MKQLLLDIVNSIVDHPDKVKLDETTDEEGNINFTLTVDPEDMGKIIGKEGKVIKSIRNIIRIPAIKQDKKVNLELTEQERVNKDSDEEVVKESSDEPVKSEDTESESSESKDTKDTEPTDTEEKSEPNDDKSKADSESEEDSDEKS